MIFNRENFIDFAKKNNFNQQVIDFVSNVPEATDFQPKMLIKVNRIIDDKRLDPELKKIALKSILRSYSSHFKIVSN